jgi:thiopurine S-methyltransferase
MNPVETYDYWSNRYRSNEIQWDCGDITFPIRHYVDQLKDKNIKILIPGCGNAYEAEYLWKIGFHNVYLLDFATEPLNNFSKRNPDFPSANLIKADYFQHTGSYDLIIEQTMFCAISPIMREDYAVKSASLLAENGKLVGVLFNRKFEGGPPFGGNQKEYVQLFSRYFREILIEPCYNSIKPRMGSEVFIKLIK